MTSLPCQVIPFPLHRTLHARNRAPSLTELLLRSLDMTQFDLTIRQGLKLCVSYEVGQAEPDVGILRPYPMIAEVRVYDEHGHARVATWLERSLTREEWEDIAERLPL